MYLKGPIGSVGSQVNKNTCLFLCIYIKVRPLPHGLKGNESIILYRTSICEHVCVKYNSFVIDYTYRHFSGHILAFMSKSSSV